jgi:tetratricopeptide (TPR) repeat protein
MLTPAQMVQQIPAERFNLLTDRDRRQRSRHRSLWWTLEWSYQLLTPELKRFLSQLSVFRGGWSLEGAKHICREPEALERLTQLRGHSLILVEEGIPEPRFRMLEAVREFAAEQVPATERVALAIRHVEYLQSLVEQAEPHLVGPEQRAWLGRLEAEHGNLRASLASCQAGAAGGEQALRLAGGLAAFWNMRGHFQEGRRWLAEILARSDAAERTLVRAKAMEGAAGLATAQGDHDAAKMLLEESMSIRQEQGDERGAARALSSLGNVLWRQGNYRAARSLHRRALRHFRHFDDKRNTADVLNSLGLVAHSQGKFARARVLYERSRAIERELGNSAGLAGTLANLGTIAAQRGDSRTARAHFEESLAVYRELGNKRTIALLLNNLGAVARDHGDHPAARAFLEESLLMERELGNRTGVARALSNLGSLASLEGNDDDAWRLHHESLSIKRELGEHRGMAVSLNNLANLACQRGDYHAGCHYGREAIEIFRSIGDASGVVSAIEGIAALALAQGDATRAVFLYAAADAQRATMRFPVPPAERALQSESLACARAKLTETGFASAWEAGRAISLNAAAEDALHGPDAGTEDEDPAPS